MTIKAYLKPHCGWSGGVRAIMQKYGLQYEDIDIINNPQNYAQMVEKTNQTLSPCVEINGIMLADVSGEEVETYMIQNGMVEASESETAVPTGSGCSAEAHAARAKAAREAAMQATEETEDADADPLAQFKAIEAAMIDKASRAPFTVRVGDENRPGAGGTTRFF